MVERCCGNCFWSISPIDEEEIIKEYHYKEDDPTRPHAGDCSLGIDRDNNYVCREHSYIYGIFYTKYFYDDKYLGPGYFIVTSYEDEIIKYLKLYRTGEYGNYCYGIRVYEYDPIKDDKNMNIHFEFDETNKNLYKVFTVFAEYLGNDIIRSDVSNNFIMAENNRHDAYIIFSKEADNNDNNNIIDIVINYDDSDRNYKIIELLYRNMAVITCNKKNEYNLKRVLKIDK